MRRLWVLTLFFLSNLAFAQLPSPTLTRDIFRALRAEMLRLDGEGLIARRDRPYDFLQTTDALLSTSLRPGNAQDFFALFKRLDGAYTNLHSYLVTSPKHPFFIPYDNEPSVWLYVDAGPGIAPKAWVDAADENSEVSIGDEVVAINGKTIHSWLDENFLFCKLPLRIQCDHNFEKNLHDLKLSWRGDSKLIYTVLHNEKLIDIEVTFKPIQSSTDLVDRKLCDFRSDKRYPGFSLAYKGRYACIFEKNNNQDTALLRISTFRYANNSNELIKSVSDEVAALFPFWEKNAGKYKNLIIDVLDNHGGNAPIPYYQIIFQSPFQEQFVKFKKTSEMEDSRLRTSMFWEENAQELSFQRWLKNGKWQNLKYGEFTEPLPMFCADENSPCEDSKFPIRQHPFQGKIILMVNENCVSSCDGFVWAMKNRANAELFGFPQAADSAYSRLRIDVIYDEKQPDHFQLQVNTQRDPFPENFLFGQIVAVTQATDEFGNIFNGRPVPLKMTVPYRFGEFYPRKVLQSVLKNLESDAN